MVKIILIYRTLECGIVFEKWYVNPQREAKNQKSSSRALAEKYKNNEV